MLSYHLIGAKVSSRVQITAAWHDMTNGR